MPNIIKTTAKKDGAATFDEVYDWRGKLVGRHYRQYFVPNGTGKREKHIWWVPAGVDPRSVLFREHLLHSFKGKSAIIVEGEHAAKDLHSRIGDDPWLVLATVCGAPSTPYESTLARLAHLEKVYLWEDDDDQGRTHMERIGHILDSLGIPVLLIPWEQQV